MASFQTFETPLINLEIKMLMDNYKILNYEIEAIIWNQSEYK